MPVPNRWGSRLSFQVEARGLGAPWATAGAVEARIVGVRELEGGLFYLVAVALEAEPVTVVKTRSYVYPTTFTEAYPWGTYTTTLWNTRYEYETIVYNLAELTLKVFDESGSLVARLSLDLGGLGGAAQPGGGGSSVVAAAGLGIAAAIVLLLLLRRR